MEKILIICGSTATGKTKLGVELAKRFGGEIVSADSRQVYRGMNIGTGKEVGGGKWEVSREVGYGKWVVDGIPIWLTDVVDPDYKFNVADYKKCADLVIKDILKRGKLPILVGGTGFYVKALVDGIGTIGVEPDWKLRERLSNCSIVSLLETLNEMDPHKLAEMNKSDRQNPRRLIRAIEIAKWKLEVRDGKLDIEVGNENKEKSHFPPRNQASHFQFPTSTLFIGLTAPNKILYEKINQRVDERVRNGIEEEIKGLLAKGYNWENSALGTTLAYREWQGYFEGKMTKEEVIKRWKFDEHEYGRRQMTWFRRDSRINWFDITKEDWQAEVENLIGTWYTHLTIICN